MTDLDAQLREYAARWRDEQNQETAASVTKAQQTLVALAEPSRRTARRRTVFAVAASVAAVAVIGAATAALTHSPAREVVTAAVPSTTPHSAPASVPWSSAGVRADTATVTTPPQVGAPTGLRRCSNSDFFLIAGTTQRAASDDGWLSSAFVLRSTAATPCAVTDGLVEATLVDGAGATLPVDAVPTGGPPALLSMLEVRPGQLVSGTALWAVYQGRAPKPTHLVIDLSGQVGTTSPLTIPVGSVTIPPHPRDPSNVGPWRATANGSINRVADPGTLASLTAALTVPATVRNGDVLRYTVTLTNPTTTPVNLTHCPDFTERLDVIPSKVPTTIGFRGPLNCAQAPQAIGAGQSVRFAYELPTTGEVPGPAQLTWQLLAGSHAAVDVTTQLTVQP